MENSWRDSSVWVVPEASYCLKDTWFRIDACCSVPSLPATDLRTDSDNGLGTMVTQLVSGGRGSK